MFLVASQRAKRVLLVDDDQEIVEALGNGLKRRGFRVNWFRDPAAALSAFIPQSYDVAVLDVRMGPMDGFELSRRLKGLDPHLAVCFLSAYSDSIRDKPDGFRFLQKPISLTDLVQALETA